MSTGEKNYTNSRLRSSYLSTIVSISLILFALGLLGMLILDAKKISDYVKEHVQLVVFLNDDAGEAEVSALQHLLESSDFVRTLRYVSKEEALDSLKNSLGADAVSMLESNPLPASLDVNMKASYANADSITKIIHQLGSNAAIREINYQQNELGLMTKNIRTISFVILLFSSLLFIIAFALINNTVRLAVYSKRFLIKSMQLVGATKGFIRMPFLKRGFLNGLYGAIVACMLLSGLMYLIQREFPGLIQLRDIKTTSLLFGSIIILGLLLSGISTFFAVRRYLRLKVDELYF